MPETVKEQEKDLKKIFETFKTTMEKHDSEIKAQGEASSETKAALDKIQDHLDEVETKLERMAVATPEGGAPPPEGGEGDDLTEMKAYGAFLRFGEHKLTQEEERLLTKAPKPQEGKVLTRGDDTTGGYLAPEEYVEEIIKGITEFSPIRTLARVRSTSRHSIQIPKRTGTFSAAWVSEIGTRSETTGLTWGLEEVPTHEMYALVDISTQNLEDSAFDLEAELAMEFSEQFGVLEGTGFVSGNAVGKPEGIITNATVLANYVASGAASTLTADGLIDLAFALNSDYFRNASWILNRLTVRDIRKLKDGNGQYLWQPGLQGAAPATILERPYTECTDMPTVTTNTYSVAIGDWRRAYTIVDRVEMATLRDPYTQATAGAVRFIARKRVGGQVTLPEACKVQKTAAS